MSDTSSLHVTAPATPTLVGRCPYCDSTVMSDMPRISVRRPCPTWAVLHLGCAQQLHADLGMVLDA